MLSNYGSIVTCEQDINCENLEPKSCWDKVKYAFLSCFKREEDKQTFAPDIKNYVDEKSIKVQKYETFNGKQRDTYNDQTQHNGDNPELEIKYSFDPKAYLKMPFPMESDTESLYISDDEKSLVSPLFESDLREQGVKDFSVGADLRELGYFEDNAVGVDLAGMDREYYDNASFGSGLLRKESDEAFL